MNIILHENLLCSHEALKRLLPARFLPLVDKRFFGKTVTLVVFPDRIRVATGSCVRKAQKQLSRTDGPVLYFARCFTLEASALIQEADGAALSLIAFPWTDEGYHAAHGGRQR